MSDIKPRIFEEQPEEHSKHLGERDAQATHNKRAKKPEPVNTPADPRPNVDVKPTGSPPAQAQYKKPEPPKGVSFSALIGKKINLLQGGYAKTGILIGVDGSGIFVWFQVQQDKVVFIPFATLTEFSVPDDQL